MNKIISYIRLKLAAWRQHREDQQFLTGYRWARMAYHEEGRTLEWIEAHEEEFGGTVGPFEHGVQQATHELRKLETMSDRLNRLYQDLNTEHDEVTETNANGDPVGVPFFIHQGNFNPSVCPDCEGAGVIYEGGMSMNPEIDNEVPCSRCSSNSGE